MAHLKKAASGHLLKNADGHLVKDCGESPAPCEYDEDLTGDYRIVGYNDGDLAGCEDCSDYEGGGAAWNGVFTWSGTPGYWHDPATATLKIDGKVVNYPDSEMIWLAHVIEYDPECFWSIMIQCTELPGTTHIIWHGDKNTGGSPAGVYTRSAGCDTTETITIEAVP